ncbi:MAG: M48 family metalloprotease [Bacteroidota bacterium]
MKRLLLPITRLALLAIAVLLISDCSRNPVTGKRELMLLSESQEKALGLESDPGIIASYGLYQDDKIQNFIQQKGQQMGKISHRPDLDYKFRVLDSPVVNAFAVPGGFVYFTRGILAHFNNEAEFAGVLGHEIGHITARHSASQYSKQMLAQSALVMGVAVSSDFREYAGLASQGLGLLFLKFGRDDETQSDRLGVEYSTQIGYDAREMADFFNTLKRLSGGGGQQLPSFLSTHPDPGDRYNKVKQEAIRWQKAYKGQQLNVNRDSYLQLIDGLTYGEDPRQGYVEGNTFYHPDLKFSFPVPANWQTVNSASQVQIAEKDGRAVMIFTLGQGNSPAEAANQMLQQYQLRSLSQRQTTINGFPAVIMDAAPQPQQQQQQQQQQDIRILSYFIQYGQNIYTFLGVSETKDYNYFTPIFEGTMRNFNKLSDPSKINVQPERIKVVTIQQNTTLQQALLTNGISNNRLNEFAILNGMELKDSVPKGMKIKVITR